MSRRKHLARALASGYAAMCANTLYTLASVPLALSYLTKTEFGLWALITQLSGYIALVDFGMAASLSRILIDHKDRKGDGIYGSTIKTGWIVLIVQGIIAAALGSALSPLLGSALKIPTNLFATFTLLMAWQCLLLGFSFATKMFAHLLTAHQRYDITNYSQLALFACNFTVLWFCFHRGLGLFSMVWAGVAGAVVSIAIAMFACSRLRLYPPASAWGRVSWPIFRELFIFGSELFIQVLGWQLLSASQIVVVTRFLGLESAAVWSICTKVFTLAQQVVFRLFDFSISAFSEMEVRGERHKLRERFHDVLCLSGSIGVYAGIVVATCNHAFVQIWTHGKVAWLPINDAFMAGLLITTSVNRCYGGLAWVTKQVKFMRFIYFVEGLIFVSVAIAIVSRTQFAGLILAAMICNILCSGSYGLARTAKQLGVSSMEIALGWLLPVYRFTLIFGPVALGMWFVSQRFAAPMQFGMNAVGGGLLGAALFWFFGLSDRVRREMRDMMRKGFASLSQKFFPKAAG